MIIAVAVLVPFGGLVAWGLGALHESAALPLPPAAAPPAPSVAPSGVVEAAPVGEPPASSAAAPPAQRQNLAPAPTVEDPAPALARHAVVQQLDPLVRSCFAQTPHERRREGPKIATLFNVLPDGTLADVQVRSKRPDSVLTACVTAALQAAVLDPKRGIPEEPVHHTFHFKSKR